MAYIVPAVNILLFIFLLTIVIKIPVIWSAIISITGYMAFTIIQVSLILLSFDSISEAKSSFFYIYWTQTMSSLLCIALAWLLYKFGIGFTFDFEKLRIRWEGVLVGGMILLFLLLLSFFMYKNEMLWYVLFFPSALIFLLYYSVRKEKMND